VPPGGVKSERKQRLSEYGLQLREKQKLRPHVRRLERQFRNYYQKAAGRPGATGETLLQFWSAAWTMWCIAWDFASTRAEARSVGEPQSRVGERKVVNIASYQCKAGDVIACERRPKKQTRLPLL